MMGPRKEQGNFTIFLSVGQEEQFSGLSRILVEEVRLTSVRHLQYLRIAYAAWKVTQFPRVEFTAAFVDLKKL
jgi:hypothetical protein